MKKRPTLSIIVPVYEEEDNLRPLAARLTEALDGEGAPEGDWEVLFVDDGSEDDSPAVLRELCDGEERFKAITLRRNFGQTAAMAAGFDHARGEILIVLDADLQNDPADIPAVVAKLDEGYDVVSGWRRDRKDTFLTRVLPSRMANWIISYISGVRLHDYGCSLKAYKREFLEGVRLYGEMHRFIPIFASWQGARVGEMPVRHHPRRAGTSKYGLERTFKVLLDLITIQFLHHWATKPIYLFGGLGMLACAGGLLSAGIALAQRIFAGVKTPENPLLLLAVFLFLVGLQLVMMGLLAELSIRIYHESQSKPIYLVRDLRNLPDGPRKD